MGRNLEVVVSDCDWPALSCGGATGLSVLDRVLLARPAIIMIMLSSLSATLSAERFRCQLVGVKLRTPPPLSNYDDVEHLGVSSDELNTVVTPTLPFMHSCIPNREALNMCTCAQLRSLALFSFLLQHAYA